MRKEKSPFEKKSQIKLVIMFNPLSAKFIKWSNTLKQIVGKLPTICLSVFDHFSGLAFKGLIKIIFPERFPHPDKCSWGISCDYLSGWPEPTEEKIIKLFVLYYLHKFLKLYISQTKSCLNSCFLLLLFLLRDFFLLLIQ